MCNASLTACLTACGTTDANCVTGFYCDGVGLGACQPTRASGAMCTRNAECVSDTCTGGTCM
jgi:hypothetical protein